MLMVLLVFITSPPIINIISMVVMDRIVVKNNVMMVLHMVMMNKKEVVLDVVMDTHPHCSKMLHAKYVRSMGTRPNVIGYTHIMMMIPIPSDNIAYVVSVYYGVDTNWYTDTGATNHITGELNKLITRDNYKGYDQVHMTNGNGMEIMHDGHSTLHTPHSSFLIMFYMFPRHPHKKSLICP
jgi:hypothetical protein